MLNNSLIFLGFDHPLLEMLEGTHHHQLRVLNIVTVVIICIAFMTTRSRAHIDNDDTRKKRTKSAAIVGARVKMVGGRVYQLEGEALATCRQTKENSS